MPHLKAQRPPLQKGFRKIRLDGSSQEQTCCCSLFRQESWQTAQMCVRATLPQMLQSPQHDVTCTVQLHLRLYLLQVKDGGTEDR